MLSSHLNTTYRHLEQVASEKGAQTKDKQRDKNNKIIYPQEN